MLPIYLFPSTKGWMRKTDSRIYNCGSAYVRHASVKLHLGVVFEILKALFVNKRNIFFYKLYRVICAEVQDIVCPLRLFPKNKITLQVDLAVGDPGFHCDLVPAPFGDNRRGDILKIDILFAHLTLWQYRTHIYFSVP